MIRITVSFLPLFLFTAAAFADVRLPEIFDNNMVLQRDMPVPIWGWAEPQESVMVAFNGQTKAAVAGADGRWQVNLDSLKAGGPFTLTIGGKNRITLENVMVGEVWLCSGQSNMEWPMAKSAEYQEALKTIDNPNIRLFHVKKALSNEPAEKLNLIASWKPCNAKTIPDFSAVGYYFGSKLQKELGVPVGLINSSWGGTRIEPWTPPAGFESVPALKNLAEEIASKNPQSASYKALTANTLQAYRSWLENAEKTAAEGKKSIAAPPAFPGQLQPYNSPSQPTTLYNAMVHPFVPFAIKGAIWYQGESNNGEGMLYAEKMKALILGWRQVFNNPDLGFYYVQLAPFTYNRPGALPDMWAAQSSIEKALPKTGQAVINDLVSNIRDIHPPKKQPVGERLALLALNRTYAKTDVVCASPEFDTLETNDDVLTVSFKNAQSLKTRNGSNPDWFEIAGIDGTYHKADAVIAGTKIKLTSPNVRKPFAVRFAWNEIAEPNVQNEAGLPLGAFRAGEVPERAVLDELVPAAKNFKLIYRFDPTKPAVSGDKTQFVYASDYSGDITGKIKRVGYFCYLTKGEKSQYVFVAMPPLDNDPKKLGVPVKSINKRYQQAVKDVEVIASNVDSVKTGQRPGGWIEFWECNYGEKNTANVAGASSDKFDFGDDISTGSSPGYGSMQIHLPEEKLTIFAFNNFAGGNGCDVGIGNNPDANGNPDWTFAKNGASYSGGQFLILAEME